MDYFIYDAQIRLEEVRVNLSSKMLDKGERAELSQREHELINLINLYEKIRENLHNNHLENSLVFSK